MPLIEIDDLPKASDFERSAPSHRGAERIRPDA
jgi:hypothetical protein